MEKLLIYMGLNSIQRNPIYQKKSIQIYFFAIIDYQSYL